MQADKIISAHESLYESLRGHVGENFVNHIPTPNLYRPVLKFSLTNILVTGQPTHRIQSGHFYNYVFAMRQYSAENRFASTVLCRFEFNLYNVKQQYMSALDLSKLLYETMFSIYSVYTLNYRTKVDIYEAPSFDGNGREGADELEIQPAASSFTLQSPASGNVWEALNRITRVAERLV